MLVSRTGWSLAALAVASVWLIAPDTSTAATAATGSDFPEALLAIASLLQLAVASWVLVVIALSRLGPTARIARAFTPEAMRRALFVGTVGALALTPAQADRGSSPAHSTVRHHSLDGLRLPDRPVTVTSAATSVVVRPGDTLWAIAARSLSPGASSGEIADACARWYDANRAVIGTDPDLIHPSQHLNPPPAKDVP